MKFLRSLLDRQAKHFEKGKPLAKLYPLYEAIDTLAFTPGQVTTKDAHVRDGFDLKRMMTVVIIGLIGCILMAMYNTGLQAHLVIEASGGADPAGWRAGFMKAVGLSFSSTSILACFVHGALYYLPVLIVTFAAGLGCEVLFSAVRNHDVNEGFFVTGMLFPLIVPPTIPLWQVALGIMFGAVISKEVFGGTGMNIFNPALMARAFLFFAYPAQISGDAVWVAVDGFSGATLLTQAAAQGSSAFAGLDGAWMNAFLGFIPGSMGETSAAACLFGAIVLISMGVGSWRIILGVVVGTILCTLGLNALAGYVNNPFFDVPFYWHMVLGGWAFGTVYMATDPVTAPYSNKGRWVYGLLIGVFVVLIRVVNPAYPEAMMLVILFMNVFAALIDHVVVQMHIKKRRAHYAS